MGYTMIIAYVILNFCAQIVTLRQIHIQVKILVSMIGYQTLCKIRWLRSRVGSIPSTGTIRSETHTMRRLTNMRMPWWLVDIGMYTSSDILMEFITSVRPRKAILTHCCFLEICIVSPVCTYERQIHIRYWHVAQLDRAQRYGRWCCRFESCHVNFNG